MFTVLGSISDPVVRFFGAANLIFSASSGAHGQLSSTAAEGFLNNLVRRSSSKISMKFEEGNFF